MDPEHGTGPARRSTPILPGLPARRPREASSCAFRLHAHISNAELFESAPMNGAHVTIDLGSGLRARVPLALSEAEAGASAKDSGKLDLLRAAARSDRSPNGPAGHRHAAGRCCRCVECLPAFLSGTWTESGVDWDARLLPQLELAYAANTRDAQRDALRQLVADARDGHGRVVDAQRGGERARLPIQLGFIDGQLVVTASDMPADVPVGAVVSAIDGIRRRSEWRRRCGSHPAQRSGNEHARSRKSQPARRVRSSISLSTANRTASGQLAMRGDATSRRNTSSGGHRVDVRCLVCRLDPDADDATHARTRKACAGSRSGVRRSRLSDRRRCAVLRT